MYSVSWRYDGGYVPISEYAQAVEDTSLRLSPALNSHMAVYIASDSPAASAELVKVLPSDILLFSLAQSQDPQLRTLASPREYIQHEFNKLGMEERINLTRGMIIDFALVSGMWAWNDDVVPNAIICTIRFFRSFSLSEIPTNLSSSQFECLQTVRSGARLEPGFWVCQRDGRYEQRKKGLGGDRQCRPN